MNLRKIISVQLFNLWDWMKSLGSIFNFLRRELTNVQVTMDIIMKSHWKSLLTKMTIIMSLKSWFTKRIEKMPKDYSKNKITKRLWKFTNIQLIFCQACQKNFSILKNLKNLENTVKNQKRTIWNALLKWMDLVVDMTKILENWQNN